MNWWNELCVYQSPLFYFGTTAFNLEEKLVTRLEKNPESFWPWMYLWRIIHLWCKTESQYNKKNFFNYSILIHRANVKTLMSSGEKAGEIYVLLLSFHKVCPLLLNFNLEHALCTKIAVMYEMGSLNQIFVKTQFSCLKDVSKSTVLKLKWNLRHLFLMGFQTKDQLDLGSELVAISV